MSLTRDSDAGVGAKVGSAIREVSTDVCRSENPLWFASTAGSDGALGVATGAGVNVGVDTGLGAANVSVLVTVGAGVGVAKIAGDDAGSIVADVVAGVRFHAGAASVFGASVDVDAAAAGVTARSRGRSPLIEGVVAARGVAVAAELVASDFIALALPSSSSKSFAAVTFCG